MCNIAFKTEIYPANKNKIFDLFSTLHVSIDRDMLSIKIKSSGFMTKRRLK